MFLLSHMLTRFIRRGSLTIIDAEGVSHHFGDGTGEAVQLRFHDPKLPNKLFRNPELVTGEAYMDGTLTFDQGNVYALLALFGQNRSSAQSYPWQRMLRAAWRSVRRIRQYNPIGKAQQNVAHHYDLSRKLYALFLDEDLQYSCAYFKSEHDALEKAQENKKAHIAEKLYLKDGQRVLDIGCGFGGMALYLAKQADIHITGITLSSEQLDVARARAKAEGLQERVQFELIDYRKITGQFDRIVSVGMFEHVGVTHYDTFFSTLKSLLTDDGIALLHSIGHVSPPGTTSPWIRKYIFPGGYAPAMSEVFTATERNYLWVSDVEILRLHYAETLRHWRERFEANRAEIESMYDARFGRMWEFYLSSCEMVFRQGSSMVFQLQLASKRDAVPLTRSAV